MPISAVTLYNIGAVPVERHKQLHQAQGKSWSAPETPSNSLSIPTCV